MTIAEWDEHYSKIRHSNLLQHYPYAQAMRIARRLSARHGLISINGNPAGIAQVEEAGVLRNAIHVLSLDRGPLWFEGFGDAAQAMQFFSEFNRQFPRRIARKRRILPELAFNPATVNQLSAAGLTLKEDIPRYETIWLDISPELNVLRSRLSGKWRNSLANAERRSFTTSVDWWGQTSSNFLENYQRTKEEKNYGGPSNGSLQALISFMAPRKEVLILNAHNQGQIVASVLILLHGMCATYQASWGSEASRKMYCHNRLLWEAIAHLKERGIQHLDLGGVNREAAAGVTHFKEGMGGKSVQLCGQFH